MSYYILNIIQPKKKFNGRHKLPYSNQYLNVIKSYAANNEIGIFLYPAYYYYPFAASTAWVFPTLTLLLT